MVMYFVVNSVIGSVISPALDIACGFFHPERKCLHNVVSGTVVIDVKAEQEEAEGKK